MGFQAAEPCAADTVVQGTLAICKDSTDLTNIAPTPVCELPSGFWNSVGFNMGAVFLLVLRSALHILRAGERGTGHESRQASPFATAEIESQRDSDLHKTTQVAAEAGCSSASLTPPPMLLRVSPATIQLQ